MVKKATRISRFVAAGEDRPIYVGLDVQQKTYSVALFEPEDGVVETAAAHFLAKLFSPERFNRSEEVTSYPGLSTVVSQSGNGPGATQRPRPSTTTISPSTGSGRKLL